MSNPKKRKSNKPTNIKNIMEHPLSAEKANFAYKKSRDEKSPEMKQLMDTSTEKTGKLIRDLALLSEEMEPTNEELEFRKNKMKMQNVVLKYKQLFKCTKCNKNYQNAINNNENISMHPFLGVLMCEDCCEYYGDGNFSLDSDDEDKYCRWCGEGGKIFSCSKCIYGFCSICIKKHFGSKLLKNVEEDDNWLCFFCNPKPLWDLRFVSSLAKVKSEISQKTSEKDNSEQIKIDKKRKPGTIEQNEQDEPEIISVSTSKAKRKRIYVQDSDQDDLSLLNKMEFPAKPQMVEKLVKVLKLLEYQMSFGLNWSTKLLSKLTKRNHSLTESGLLNECQKTKGFLSLMSTHLLDFCTTVDSIEKKSLGKDGVNYNIQIEDPSTPSSLSSYSDILLFLGFVTNQVKTFMDRGISIQDLVEAEIINDGNILGIKKKTKSSPTETPNKTTPEKSQTLDCTKTPSKETPCKVLKSKNESQKKISDEAIRFESSKAFYLEDESENRAKKLTESSIHLDVNKASGNVLNESVDKFKEILAILEDS